MVCTISHNTISMSLFKLECIHSIPDISYQISETFSIVSILAQTLSLPIQKGTHILYSYKAFTANFRRIFQSVQLIQLNERNIWIDKAVSTAMGTYVPISWTCDISLVKVNKLKLNCLQTPGFG